MTRLYDTIGAGYAKARRADSRIAEQVERALGDAQTVLNVGAGAGSYEPRHLEVVAVEPSQRMIDQRPADAAPVVQAAAERLPFGDKSFDAGMAILTLHHWPDQKQGLLELRRVVRGPVVLLTFDPQARPWLSEYLPALAELDETQMPPLAAYEQWLGSVQISPVLVPHDCQDGFLYAHWRNPHAYLDERVRAASSAFWMIDGVEDGMARLAQDLASGEWRRRYAELLSADSYDAGYRLVVAS